MKITHLSFCFLTISALFICGCHWLKLNKNPKTPEEVAVAYAKAMAAENFNLASSYCDAQQSEWLFLLVQNREKKDTKISSYESGFVNAATCNIKNDTAFCVVCCDTKDANLPRTLFLRLHPDRKWRVGFSPIPEFDDMNLIRPVYFN